MPVLSADTTIKIDGKLFVRRQLLLLIARANTNHKVQGPSVNSVVFAPQRHVGPGQAYVALLRVTRLQCLHVIHSNSVAEVPLVDVDVSSPPPTITSPLPRTMR